MTRICFIAGNEEEAYRYASSQGLEKDQWFFPRDKNDLLFKKNFHVLVIGTAGMNTSPAYFEDIYQTALRRGKVERF